MVRRSGEGDRQRRKVSDPSKKLSGTVPSHGGNERAAPLVP